MTRYLPRKLAVATLVASTAAVFLATSACSSRIETFGATPASGPVAGRVSAGGEDELVVQARLIRLVDELCDEKIAHANVAATTAQSEEVRAFADELKREYTELRATLRNQSFRLGFTVIKSDRAKEFEEEVMASIETLLASRRSGFDRTFLSMTVDDHDETLAAIEKDLAFSRMSPSFRELFETEVRPVLRKNAEKSGKLLRIVE